LDKALQERFEQLRADHEKVEGSAFNYFQRPILFTDEDVAGI